MVKLYLNQEKTSFYPKKHNGKVELIVEIGEFNNSCYPILRNVKDQELLASISTETPYWITFSPRINTPKA